MEKTRWQATGKPIWAVGRWSFCWLLTVSVLLPVGCGGPGGPARVAVHGKVTVAGQAVPAGSISFVPTDGNTGPAAGGAIEDGQYSIPAQLGPVAGWNRIEILGTRKTGSKVPGPFDPKGLVDELESAVPARYGANSPLKRELKAGQDELNFDLEAV